MQRFYSELELSVIRGHESTIYFVDGVLVIDKPAGITSHDVVARVRRILKTKRVGHTGTLDPFATGVLVVLIGRATRLAQFIDKDEKEYEAVVRFGFETDTGDATGARSSGFRTEQTEIARILRAAVWENVLSGLRGEIDQLPPMYSAKKIEGKRLYEHARKGKTVDRVPVRVTVRELEITDSSRLDTPEPRLRIHVVCSAGTYVRVLAADIGRVVGVGAHLAELRRTRAGRFDLRQSVTLEALGERTTPFTALLPMDVAVEHLPEVSLPVDRIDKTRGGLSTRIPELTFRDGQPIRIHGPSGELIAIGSYDERERSVRPHVVLI